MGMMPVAERFLASTLNWGRQLAREGLVNLRSQFEIQFADPSDAVRGEVHGDFVPDIAPFGVVVHGFRNQSDSRHAAKRSNKILTLEGTMEFSILHGPTTKALQPGPIERRAEFHYRT